MSRRYLSENEVQLLLDTAQHHSLRNYCMIYLAFIHGLRASELLSLQLTDYDPLASTLSIRRIKGGLSTIHPLSPEEGHIISLWLQERSRSSSADSPWFFPSRNHTHITRQRFWQIIRLYGVMAGLTVRVHPHMLRHACGFALAERGNDTRLIQDYLGHRNIRHTVRYTATSPSRFRQAWSSPPRHTLIPEKTRPETSVAQTYHPPHGEDPATGLSPPDLSLIHHEYGVMIKNIWQELSSIQHTLRRLDLRAAAGQPGSRAAGQAVRTERTVHTLTQRESLKGCWTDSLMTATDRESHHALSAAALMLQAVVRARISTGNA